MFPGTPCRYLLLSDLIFQATVKTIFAKLLSYQKEKLSLMSTYYSKDERILQCIEII